MVEMEVDNQGEDGRRGSQLHVHDDTPECDHDILEHQPQYHVQMKSVAWIDCADNTVGQLVPHGAHDADVLTTTGYTC